MDSIKNTEGWDAMYDQPRIHAVHAYAMCTKNGEIIKVEALVEFLLNSIFEGIAFTIDKYRNEETSNLQILVDMGSTTPKHIKEEVICRLRDYGYEVNVNLPSQEEVDYYNEIADMSLEDESLDSVVSEFFYSQTEFIIRWDLGDCI